MSYQRKSGSGLCHCFGFTICKRREEPETVQPAECSSLSPKKAAVPCFCSLSAYTSHNPAVHFDRALRGDICPSLPANHWDSKSVFGPVCVCWMLSCHRPWLKDPHERAVGEHWCQECKPSFPLPLLAVPGTPQASGHGPPVPHLCLHTCQCPAPFLPWLAAAPAGRVGASAGEKGRGVEMEGPKRSSAPSWLSACQGSPHLFAGFPCVIALLVSV